MTSTATRAGRPATVLHQLDVEAIPIQPRAFPSAGAATVQLVLSQTLDSVAFFTRPGGDPSLPERLGSHDLAYGALPTIRLATTTDPASSHVGDLVATVYVDVDVDTDNDDELETDSNFDIDDDVFAVIDIDIDIDGITDADADAVTDGDTNVAVRWTTFADVSRPTTPDIPSQPIRVEGPST